MSLLAQIVRVVFVLALACGAVAGPRSAIAAGTINETYVIHPGDQLNVAVYGDATLTQSTTVLPDGDIQYPLVGRLHIGGMTAATAAHAITERLERYVRHPLVTVNLAQQGLLNIIVLGNVKTPGKYQVRNDAHLTDAIAVAGGVGPTDGDLPIARVTEPDGSLKSVSLQTLLHDGDAAQNLALTNDATVYVVGPNTFTVSVLGAVDRPGAVEVNEGDRLSLALSRAGVSGVRSDLSKVTVTRIDKTATVRHSQINMYAALEHGDLRFDPILRKGDTVFVPTARQPLQFNPGVLLGRLIGF